MDKREGTSKEISRRTFVGFGLAIAAAAPVSAKRSNPATTEAHDEEDDAQWVMVIDLARCDGCGKCTTACQERHYTGDQEWIAVFTYEDETGQTRHVPRPCMHCENAPCLNVCPVGATYRDGHGTILIDHNRCIGCRLCIAACPYGARSFNWGEPKNPPGASLARYSPEYPVPHRKGTVEKCMFCAHNTRDGKLPACVEGCPMQAIWFGDLTRDLVTNGVETASLTELLQSRDAFRLKEELGTRPRVWYLPGHGQGATEEAAP